MLLLSLVSTKRCWSKGKDIPKNVEEDHVVLIPDSDGIGKNTDYGKEVLSQNGAIVEDALRIKLGKLIGYSSLLAVAAVAVVLLPLCILSLSVTCALCSQAVRSFI